MGGSISGSVVWRESFQPKIILVNRYQLRAELDRMFSSGLSPWNAGQLLDQDPPCDGVHPYCKCGDVHCFFYAAKQVGDLGFSKIKNL